MEMVESGAIKKIMACLKTNDDESQYWALVLF